jgi:hypothetical protein
MWELLDIRLVLLVLLKFLKYLRRHKIFFELHFSLIGIYFIGIYFTYFILKFH